MTIQISSDFPLIHQIAFSSRPHLYTPSKYSLVIKEQFGEENYRLWDLETSRNFLKDFFPLSVNKAFDVLKPYAYKADLFRYCVINQLGGVYADVSVNKLKSFDTKNREMVVFRDGNSDRSSWKVGNGFFFSKPNNSILEECVAQIISNVANRYYGHDAHFPCGPSVFGRAVAKFGTEADLLVGQYWWLKNRKNKYVLPGNLVVARGKRGGAHKGGYSGIVGGNSHSVIWEDRNVYGEIN
jgi:mannosyltransferase OCH1-like enzyme